MAIRYKIDVLEALKTAGYSAYRIRKEKIMGESVLQKFREGKLPSMNELETVCELLQMQPGEILEFVHDDGKKV